MPTRGHLRESLAKGAGDLVDPPTGFERIRGGSFVVFSLCKSRQKVTNEGTRARFKVCKNKEVESGARNRARRDKEKKRGRVNRWRAGVRMRAYGYAVAVYFGMSANAPTCPNDCVSDCLVIVVVVVHSILGANLTTFQSHPLFVFFHFSNILGTEIAEKKATTSFLNLLSR